MAYKLPSMLSNYHGDILLFLVECDVQDILIVGVHQDFLIF